MTLSARKQEILGMTARALCNKEIVHHLDISDCTVTLHTQTIDRKLDVANRTEAVVVAYLQRLVAFDLPIPSVGDTI